MLRRSLILFLVFVLLGLSLTAGYALLHWHGPDDVLAEARAFLRQGDTARAVRVLDLCEPAAGMRENPELLRELWKLRLDGNRRLDNPRRALVDIDNLLRIDADNIDLQMQRAYYLMRDEQPRLAREVALAVVQKRPQLARAQELAGEACQFAYGDALRRLNKDMRTDLGPERETEGIGVFLEYLYRPEGDLRGIAALQRLQQLYEREPRFRQAWPGRADDLRDLREQIQQALGYFQRCLELAPKSKVANYYYIAAYRGAAFALQQADRNDDVVAQAEIYLTNNDHAYCSEAALDAVNAHVTDGMDDAAVELARRFLPADTWKARQAAGRLDKSVEPLLVAEAFALHRLGRLADLEQLGIQAAQMVQSGLRVDVVPTLTSCLTGLLRGLPATAEPPFWSATEYFLTQPQPLVGTDPVQALLPGRIRLAAGGATAHGTAIELVNRWIKARPNDMDPLRLKVQLQLDADQAAAAMATAATILQAEPTDERALHLLGDAAQRAYRESGQDGESLLAQCLQRGSGRPDLPAHPVCMLLCAEAALRQGRPDIARICARAAADSFPWSLWPKLVEAKAEIAAGDNAAALQILSTAIARGTEVDEPLALWLDVSLRSGAPLGEHLPQVVRRLPDSVDVQAALLRAALEERSPATAAIAAAARRRTDATPELLALAAQALARTGDPAAGRATLLQSHKLAGGRPTAAATAAQTGAAIELIAAMAPELPDDKLVDFANYALGTGLLGPTVAAALLQAVASVDAAGRPRCAYLLATNALAIGDAIEWRDAASFRQAGDLAVELGQLDAAAAHYTAALSFPDGLPAAEALARLELLRGNTDRAARAMAMVAAPLDPSLALLAKKPAAVAATEQLLRADPGDLLAAVPFALAHDVGADVIGGELRGADVAARTSALELAAILAVPQLAKAALPRAEQLRALLPKSPTAALLLARALWQAGRGADAGKLHQQIYAAGCRAPALLGEGLRAAAHGDGYVLPPVLAAELRLRATNRVDPLPPTLLAPALASLVAEARTAGNAALADTVETELWLQLTGPSHADIAAARTLVQRGAFSAAGLLLQNLRQLGTPAQRRAAATELFRLGVEHARELDAKAGQWIANLALADLDRGETVGPAFEFLLLDPRRLAGVAPAALRQYVAALLERTATALDDYRPVPTALAHARQRLGDAAVTRLLDDAIAAHPAMAMFWIERARLIADARSSREGIDDARRVLTYADAPELTLAFTTIAAEHRAVGAADFERFDRVPAQSLSSPQAEYTLGLVELRRGHADTAEQHLAAAAPTANGFHLYARALANMMRRTPDARATAARCFAELAERYASSSLSRNAGSFARQLSPN